jgi:hypothetical protein
VKALLELRHSGKCFHSHRSHRKKHQSFGRLLCQVENARRPKATGIIFSAALRETPKAAFVSVGCHTNRRDSRPLTTLITLSIHPRFLRATQVRESVDSAAAADSFQ